MKTKNHFDLPPNSAQKQREFEKQQEAERQREVLRQQQLIQEQQLQAQRLEQQRIIQEQQRIQGKFHNQFSNSNSLQRAVMSIYITVIQSM